MIKIILSLFSLIGRLSFPMNISKAGDLKGCLCIASETVQKYFEAENTGIEKDEYYVRYVPDRKDKSPHEVITNFIHRETWTFTEQG